MRNVFTCIGDCSLRVLFHTVQVIFTEGTHFYISYSLILDYYIKNIYYFTVKLM